MRENKANTTTLRHILEEDLVLSNLKVSTHMSVSPKLHNKLLDKKNESLGFYLKRGRLSYVQNVYSVKLLKALICNRIPERGPPLAPLVLRSGRHHSPTSLQRNIAAPLNLLKTFVLPSGQCLKDQYFSASSNSHCVFIPHTPRLWVTRQFGVFDLSWKRGHKSTLHSALD